MHMYMEQYDGTTDDGYTYSEAYDCDYGWDLVMPKATHTLHTLTSQASRAAMTHICGLTTMQALIILIAACPLFM
jgi:hypothetical protein